MSDGLNDTEANSDMDNDLEQTASSASTVDSEDETILVHVSGQVKHNTVVELPADSRVKDQTTPNMIQRISGIFERKPLISKEI